MIFIFHKILNSEHGTGLVILPQIDTRFDEFCGNNLQNKFQTETTKNRMRNNGAVVGTLCQQIL